MNNNMGVGVGIYGGTNANIPDQYGSGGSGTQLPHMLITRDGRVGINQNNPAQTLDITGNINCVGNAVITGTCTAASFPTSSDQSIKDNILKADYQEIQTIFDTIDVQTYTRNDGVEGSRIGFIAQDFNNVISPESKFQNIVHKITTEGQHTATEGGAGEEVQVVEEEENYILGLDYSRLCTLLWGVCKNQEQRIQALEAKIT